MAESASKLASQPTQPSGISESVDWTDDHLIVANRGGDGWTLYKHDGSGAFTKKTVPNSLADDGTACAWTSDSAYVAMGTISSTYLTWYSRSGDTLTKLTDPTSPGNDVNGLAWDPSDTYLAVAHDDDGSGNYLTIYKRSGTTLTKLASQPTQPGAAAIDVAWTPDGTYLAVATWDSPNSLKLYSRSGDTFTKETDPSSTGLGYGYAVDWDPTGGYLALGQDDSGGGEPFAWFSRSGATLTKLSIPTWPWAVPDGYFSTCLDVAWHPTLPYVAVAHNGLNGVSWLKRSNNSLSLLDAPPQVDAAGYGWSVTWDPDGTYFVVGHSGSAYLTVYEASGLEGAVEEATGSASLSVPLLCRIGPKGDYELSCPLYTSVGDVPIPGSYEKTAPLFVQVGE